MDDKVAERTNDATPEHGKHDDRPADRKEYLDQQSFRRNARGDRLPTERSDGLSVDPSLPGR